MGHVYLNNISLSEEDFSPLVGCRLVDVSEGVSENGTESITLEFVHPVTGQYIRLSFSDDGVAYISEFENE